MNLLPGRTGCREVTRSNSASGSGRSLPSSVPYTSTPRGPKSSRARAAFGGQASVTHIRAGSVGASATTSPPPVSISSAALAVPSRAASIRAYPHGGRSSVALLSSQPKPQPVTSAASASPTRVSKDRMPAILQTGPCGRQALPAHRQGRRQRQMRRPNVMAASPAAVRRRRSRLAQGVAQGARTALLPPPRRRGSSGGLVGGVRRERVAAIQGRRRAPYRGQPAGREVGSHDACGCPRAASGVPLGPPPCDVVPLRGGIRDDQLGRQRWLRVPPPPGPCRLASQPAVRQEGRTPGAVAAAYIASRSAVARRLTRSASRRR